MTGYTPGIALLPFTTIITRRELPLRGEALVAVGQRVSATTEVLRATLPGELEVLRLPDLLNCEVDQILAHLRVTPGEAVTRGALLYRKEYLWGWSTVELTLPVAGTVEFFLESTGHLGIRHPSTEIAVQAFVDGTVREIEPGRSVSIESSGALLKGVFGVGGEQCGVVAPLSVPTSKKVERSDLEQEASQASEKTLAGKILVGGSSYSLDALNYAAESGVKGVVTASIDSTTLQQFTGLDITVSITGDEKIPFPVMITEGFGHHPMSERFMSIATDCEGLMGSLSGVTQVRAGATRPLLIIPREGTAGQEEVRHEEGERAQEELRPGSMVKVVRGELFGRVGRVMDLPSDPQAIPTGAFVRVLTANFVDGSIHILPRANVEVFT